MKLLSIGSVIRKNDIELIITGYHINAEENGHKLYYIVSLFPVGIISGQEKSQGYFDVSKDYELVFEGYRDEYCEKYLAQIAKRAESLKNIPAELICAVLKKASENLEANKK